MAKYVTGDPMVLANMRFTGRLIFALFAVAALTNLVLALTGHPYSWIAVTAMLLGCVMMWALMRRYHFGLTWHRHIGR